MITDDPNTFLFIEPAGAPTAPVIDDITRAATALWRATTPSKIGYRGVHRCTGRGCTVHSDNRDHALPDGRNTHSLLVHYVACHRDDVPAEALAWLGGLTVLAEPTENEWSGRTWAARTKGAKR